MAPHQTCHFKYKMNNTKKRLNPNLKPKCCCVYHLEANVTCLCVLVIGQCGYRCCSSMNAIACLYHLRMRSTCMPPRTCSSLQYAMRHAPCSVSARGGVAGTHFPVLYVHCTLEASGSFIGQQSNCDMSTAWTLKIPYSRPEERRPVPRHAAQSGRTETEQEEWQSSLGHFTLYLQSDWKV